ncbi:MAG: VOC family protein [Tranquillimonas sp.]
MIACVTIGADDLVRAKRFYSALLPALGYASGEKSRGLCYVLPRTTRRCAALPGFHVRPPFDGLAASAGNGAMIAFEARRQKQVRDLHSAALAAGGSDEGGPGFRATCGPRVHVGYLRDPRDNKIALLSDDPSERGRG